MVWVVYGKEEEYNMYVTHVEDGAVGEFNDIRGAIEFDSLEKAQEVCDWLNEPETFYHEKAEYFIKEIK